jgi:hypothetical protein
MSMNESERRLNNKEHNFSIPGRVVPTDFSEEDIAFAQELDALFDPEKEELPPYFAQTLLAPEDPLFRVVEHGFEHKTRARVFRPLKLRRRLFCQHESLLATLTSSTARRSMLVLVVASLLFMLLTMAFTRQSFLEGAALLLHDSRAGVYQVHNYPGGVSRSSSASNDAQPTMISLLATQQRLHFPMYWPQVTSDNYALDNINLYQQPDQSWADGPILELQYDYTPPGSTTHNVSEIAIREFKPNADVLQVVESGAAQSIQLDPKGHTQAIYVDGQWVSLNRYSHRWVYGERGELIYERDGVVFWIVSDQRDGAGKNVLLQLAQSLQVINMTHMLHLGVEMGSVRQLVDDSSGLFSGDIIAVLPDDNLTGPYLTLVGPDQPPQENPIHKHPTSPHLR